MANINIANLPTTGLNLFSDSESHLKKLSDKQLNLKGGKTYWSVGVRYTWNF